MSYIPALHRSTGCRISSVDRPAVDADATRRAHLAAFMAWLADTAPSAEEAMQDAAVLSCIEI